jgi:hypothetical protein
MALRNPLNRPMRTRTSGGVAGESGRPLPLCRCAPSMIDLGLAGVRKTARENKEMKFTALLPIWQSICCGKAFTYIQRLRVEGGRTYLGRSATVLKSETEKHEPNYRTRPYLAAGVAEFRRVMNNRYVTKTFLTRIG